MRVTQSTTALFPNGRVEGVFQKFGAYERSQVCRIGEIHLLKDGMQTDAGPCSRRKGVDAPVPATPRLPAAKSLEYRSLATPHRNVLPATKSSRRSSRARFAP